MVPPDDSSNARSRPRRVPTPMVYAIIVAALAALLATVTAAPAFAECPRPGFGTPSRSSVQAAGGTLSPQPTASAANASCPPAFGFPGRAGISLQQARSSPVPNMYAGGRSQPHGTALAVMGTAVVLGSAIGAVLWSTRRRRSANR